METIERPTKSAEQGGAEAARHPIGVVSRRTGLTQDLIRAWERRYAAVEPQRTPTNRRYYTDADVERLNLLQSAIAGGRSIGQVAELSDRELAALVAEDHRARAAGVAAPSVDEEPPERADAADGEGEQEDGEQAAAGRHLAGCLDAVRSLDGRALAARLDAAAVELGRTVLFERLLTPLMRRVGELWMAGELRPAHEHLATAAVRSLLAALARGEAEPAPGAPLVVVTTPAHQVHEVGALLVTATALSMGWRATYLGPSLPAEEIAAAARSTAAAAVALSITYPPDDPRLDAELERLARLLAGDDETPAVPLLVGGRAAGGYATAADGAGVFFAADLGALRRLLDRLRRRR